MPRLRIDIARGRLVITGEDMRRASVVRGATLTTTRSGAYYALSLTIEALRSLRTALNLERQAFASLCAANVLRWARAAHAAEEAVRSTHARLERGERAALPWDDATGDPDTGAYRPPFAHQVVMASAALWLDGLAFLCGMGTGKTRAGIEAMRARLESGELQHILIVAPKGVVGTWANEFQQWWRSPCTILRLDRGSVAQRRTAIARALQANAPSIAIINYEVLAKIVVEYEGARFPFGLYFDEGHRLRNASTQVSKAAQEIARFATWRVIATGTLVLQGPQDVWAPWYTIDFGVTFGANFAQFKREFFTENPQTFMLYPHNDTPSIFAERLARRGVSFRKEDCLDLPPKVYEKIDVEMTREQTKAYTQMKYDLVAELEAMGTAATAATQLVALLRLSQITSGFLPTLEGELHRFDPNPKLEALLDILEEQHAQQQIIVWAWYREDIARITLETRRRLGLRPVVIQGGMTPAERDAAQNAFQAGEARLLVANPSSGGTGLNLWKASLAIYYSQNASREHRAQSEDRCHRSGSERHASITYIDLVCRGTIDGIVLQTLRRKASVAEAVEMLRSHLGSGAFEETN